MHQTNQSHDHDSHHGQKGAPNVHQLWQEQCAHVSSTRVSIQHTATQRQNNTDSLRTSPGTSDQHVHKYTQDSRIPCRVHKRTNSVSISPRNEEPFLKQRRMKRYSGACIICKQRKGAGMTQNTCKSQVLRQRGRGATLMCSLILRSWGFAFGFSHGSRQT